MKLAKDIKVGDTPYYFSENALKFYIHPKVTNIINTDDLSYILIVCGNNEYTIRMSKNSCFGMEEENNNYAIVPDGETEVAFLNRISTDIFRLAQNSITKTLRNVLGIN